MQAPVLEHFLDAFEPLCRGLSESSVAMGGGRVSTRVDRFDPLKFLCRLEMLLCGSDSCVGLCRYIDIYVYSYKLHKGLV